MLVFDALLSASLGAFAGQFPIGLYNATTPEDYPLIAAAGFNFVDIRDGAVERQGQLAKAAAALGLSAMANPRKLTSSNRSEFGWPISAWHLFDEPEVNGDSLESIAGVFSEVKGWDREVPCLIVIGEGKYASRYAPWADIIALDWYPVPHLPLQSLGTELALAVSGAGSRPVWTILQAMDWRDYPQRNPHAPRIGRFPHYWELRFMALLSLVKGARGLLFYTYTKPNKMTLKEFPSQWAVLARVTAELREIRPFLDAGPGIALPLAGNRAGRRWTLGRRTLTILVDSDHPQNPLVMR